MGYEDWDKLLKQRYKCQNLDTDGVSWWVEYTDHGGGYSCGAWHDHAYQAINAWNEQQVNNVS